MQRRHDVKNCGKLETTVMKACAVVDKKAGSPVSGSNGDESDAHSLDKQCPRGVSQQMWQVLTDYFRVISMKSAIQVKKIFFEFHSLQTRYKGQPSLLQKYFLCNMEYKTR